MDGNLFSSPHPARELPPGRHSLHGEDDSPLPQRRSWRVGPFLVTMADALRDAIGQGHPGQLGLQTGGAIAKVAVEGAGACAAGDGSRRGGVATVTLAFAASADASVESSIHDALTITFRAADAPDLEAALARHGPGRIVEPRASMLSTFLLSLAGSLAHASADDLPLLETALQSVLVMALRRAPAQSDGPSRSIALLRGRAVDVIAQNLASARLDVTRIAELSGISRTMLYRLFEADGGVAKYVRRLRLEMVRKDLCDPAEMDTPISKLAQRHGLYCTASFNRSFLRLYGETPGRIREKALIRHAGRDCATTISVPCIALPTGFRSR